VNFLVAAQAESQAFPAGTLFIRSKDGAKQSLHAAWSHQRPGRSRLELAPVHIGKPEAIGVDPDRPMETLGVISVADDELPLFWACGVTPQLAIRRAAPDICITHRSAHMLVTDIPVDTLRDRTPEDGLTPGSGGS